MKIKTGDFKAYARFARQHARRFLSQKVTDSRTPIASAPHKPEPASWSDDQLTVAWLGHATVLMNFYVTWLLTDPALRAHIGVNIAGITIGPRRIVQPALYIKELPPLDAALVPHPHIDHWPLGTARPPPRQASAGAQDA